MFNIHAPDICHRKQKKTGFYLYCVTASELAYCFRREKARSCCSSRTTGPAASVVDTGDTLNLPRVAAQEEGDEQKEVSAAACGSLSGLLQPVSLASGGRGI
jgi:hypothetical protein